MVIVLQTPLGGAKGCLPCESGDRGCDGRCQREVAQRFAPLSERHVASDGPVGARSGTPEPPRDVVCHHDGREIWGSRRDRRHDRRIGDGQTFDAMDGSMSISDGT